MGQAGSSQRFPPEPNSRESSRPQYRRPRYGFPNPLESSERGLRSGIHGPPITSSSAHHNPEDMPRQPLSWAERVDFQDLVGQNGSVTRSSSVSGIGRQSRMSRLGTRILPNSVLRNLLNSGEETQAEGRALRDGLQSRILPRSESPQPAPYFPSFRNLNTRGISRRRSARAPYPFSRRESALLHDSAPNDTFSENPSDAHNTDPSRLARRYRTRLSHVRHSISNPISHMFYNHSSQSNDSTPPPPRRPSQGGLPDDSDHLLHHHGTNDANPDLDEANELDGIESSSRPRSVPNMLPGRQSSTAAPNRSNASTMRSRATRLLRREEQTPLSRVLQLAATAIAAQLSGTTSPAVPSIQSVGADGLDGPLESLMNGLQQVSTSQESTNNGDAPRDPNVPHVNFLRVFRFVNQDDPATRQPSGEEGDINGDQMDVEGQGATEDRQERRLLTLVVVGVRAIPPSNGTGGDAVANNRLNVESLLRLPLLAPGNFLRNDRGSSNFLRRSDGRYRFSPRRYSVGGSTIPPNHESQRYFRSQTSSRRQSDVGSFGDSAGSFPPVFSDTPQGPHPPPSTPADAGLSRVSSAVNTPSRRPSSASAILPQLNEDAIGDVGDTLGDRPFGFNPARQRRRSDSEAARHRGLGSGAARRNGVVGPDDQSPAAGRSWLIYVVGTNLAENHPAFAAPSLFTDNPTYEDMLLLSSLLGPVKPPVATQGDLSSAGGLYRLVESSGVLAAESLNGEDLSNVSFYHQDQCLICLCDYKAADEIRILTKCRHAYHRECVDHWLTTGRNSCPLCRGEGVFTSNNRAGSEATAS